MDEGVGTPIYDALVREHQIGPRWILPTLHGGGVPCHGCPSCVNIFEADRSQGVGPVMQAVRWMHG